MAADDNRVKRLGSIPIGNALLKLTSQQNAAGSLVCYMRDESESRVLP
jgi:hypothetical protein